MKRTLYSTTALAAAGLLTLGASNAFAQAAAPAAPEKLKMNIGGFFTAMVGYADQDGDFERANSTEYTGTDIKTNSELMFSGSVKLDNGMTVALQIEFETDDGTTTGGGSTLDEAFMRVTMNQFGETRLGFTDTVQNTLHSGAPNAGNVNASNAETSQWLIRPSAGQSNAAAFGHPSGADANRIVYITPSLAGFRAAVDYTPSTTSSDNQPTTGAATGDGSQTWATALQYNDKIGDFGVKATVSALWSDGAATTTSANKTVQYIVGGELRYADFVAGGSIRRQRDRANSAISGATGVGGDIDGWDAGIGYQPGPYSIVLRTTQAATEGLVNTPGEDTARMYKLGANYTLGPGVELRGDLISMSWDDENSVAARQNEGWAVIGGIAVSF